MEDISNKTITIFLLKKTRDNKKNVGVFPCNYEIKLISFHSMMKESGACYPFIIMNTNRSNKWTFLDLHPKKEIFLFDSFGFKCFKEFVLQNDQKVLNKILYDFEKFNKKDNEITLITLKFSI